jgi:hypothetical protein
LKLLLAAVSLFFLSQLAVSQQQQQQQNQKGSIEGTVVRIGTGEPVAARVSLSRVLNAAPGPTPAAPAAPTPNAVPGALSGAVVSRPPAQIPSVMTDSQGKFIFKDLDPGSYRMTVAANAYARQEYGQRILTGGQGTPIPLAAGQNVKDIVIQLTPTGDVGGRISDENARPAVGVQVQLLRTSYDAAGQRRFQSAGSTRTNDRGEYRLFWVTPGRYFLMAGSQSGPSFQPLETGGVGDSPNGIRESYASSYYPGVMNVRDARVLDVSSGVELNAVDLTTPRQQLYRVRGRIIDAGGQRPAYVSLSLSGQSITGGNYVSSIDSGYNAATGEFELRNVTPGSYSVTAQVTDSNQPGLLDTRTSRPTAYARITVTDSDLENIVLTISAGVSIPGRLAADGQDLATLAGLDRISVQLRPYNPDGAWGGPGAPAPPRSQPIKTDGTFQVDNVLPGQYRVTGGSLPPNFYIKEARYDQTDVLNNTLTFSGSVPGSIDVVISPGTAQFDGTVVDNGKPVAGVQVVLVPDQHRDRTELFKTALTDQNGHFAIRNVPPDSYKVFAWEAIEQYAYFDPDAMQRFELQGTRVQLAESDKQTVEVKLIRADR